MSGVFRQTAARRGLARTLMYLVEAVAARTLLGFLRLLPFGAASALGSGLFRAVGPRLRAHRIARRNLVCAFPDWDAARIDACLRGVWDNLGRGAGEFAHVDRIDAADPNGRVEVIGLEHLLAAREAGAFVVMSAHMANWEVASVVPAAHGFPLNNIYRSADNPWMDSYVRRIRGRFTNRLIPKGLPGAREAMAGLKAGQPLGLLLDQKLNEGVPVPFFGRPAMTAAAPVEMALRLGLPLLPVRLERIEKTRFRVTIHAPMEPPATGDRRADTLAVLTQFNAMLEDWVRDRPEQWFWVHKRWPD
jgi:KDO2-lipid IV(A) lauroyltransferase